MRRHIGVIGAVLLLAAGLSVPAATAARHLLVGDLLERPADDPGADPAQLTG